MSPVNGLIVFSLLLTAIYFLSIVSFLQDYESGKCEMTYMFEYPQYVHIKNEADLKHRRYGLYVYSEGRLIERARRMEFTGIPVLFIPGSAGSHKQVRSLASVALRKALNSKTKFHFDYFTVDLNNELSALNGALLDEQLSYVNESIKTVLNLYKKSNSQQKRTSIILVGHSMGGVIANAFTLSLPSDSQLVPIVITLAAPIKRPVINLDHYFDSFYKKHQNLQLPKRTTAISIAGGFNDFLVYPILTEGTHLQMVATHVPRCWVSTDHLSILWCKQLVLAINRALFDCVDNYSKRITDDSEKRLQIFNHHLVKNSGIRINELYKYEEIAQFSSDGQWMESEKRQFTVNFAKGTREVHWFMVPIKLTPNSEHLNVLALNLEARDWAFICPANVNRLGQKFCDSGRHLTQLSEIAPSVRHKRRLLDVNMHGLKMNYSGGSHIAIKILPTSEFVTLHFDVSNPRERVLTVENSPAWYSWQPEVILPETEEKAVKYEIVLPHFTHVLQTYSLHLEPKCLAQGHHSSVSLKVPWSNHEDHRFITDLSKNPAKFKLYKSKPSNFTGEAKLSLILDPSCRYKISLRTSFDLASFARFYSTQLIAYFSAVVLMTLSTQLKHMDETQRCSVVFTALKEGAKPYYIITTMKVLPKLLGNQWITNYLPEPDPLVVADENLDLLLMPMILYFISVGLVWIISVVLSISFVCFESTLHKLGLKIFSKAFSGRMLWTEHILKAFEKIPGIIAGVLIAISYSTCGGLAVCLATIFYFLKLTQMAQDFIEDLVKNLVKSVAFKLGERFWPQIMRKIFGGKKATKETGKEALEFKKLEQIEAPSEQNEEAQGSSSTEGNSVNKESRNSLEEKEEASEKDEEEFDADVPLEKPMEIEILPSENAEVEMVDGDKLVEILSNSREALLSRSQSEETQNSNETTEKDTSKTLNFELKFEWIKEIIENNEIFFHFTIFLMYLIVAGLGIPSVLTWARNYRFNKSLSPDPMYLPALILCTCTIPLWQLSFPEVHRKYLNELSYAIYGCAIVALTYGQVSIYRLSFLLAGAVALITLHQMFATQKPEVTTSAEAPSTNDDSYNAKVKSKWD